MVFIQSPQLKRQSCGRRLSQVRDINKNKAPTFRLHSQVTFRLLSFDFPKNQSMGWCSANNNHNPLHIFVWSFFLLAFIRRSWFLRDCLVLPALPKTNLGTQKVNVRPYSNKVLFAQTLSNHSAHLLDDIVSSPCSNHPECKSMAPSVSSNFTQLFFFSWTKGAGWSCLPLLKRRESFNILFCILLPQITLSNLRLAGNLEILILIRRISIAKGEGALGHILCSGRGSRVNCNALESNKVRDFLKCIQKNKLGQRARCNFSRSFLLRLHCPRRDSGYVFHLQISSCGLAKFSAWLLT